MKNEIFKKYSKKEIVENLIKIGDILDRLDEETLVAFIDDFNEHLVKIAGDSNQEYIEIEADEEENDLIDDTLRSLRESLGVKEEN